MSHCTLYPQEHKMIAYSRRSSTTSEAGSSSAVESSTRRPSIADTHRRSSLAGSFSLRLTKSKKSQSSASESTSKGTSRLGALFFSLPPEIQSLILSYVPSLPSLFNLRLTSRNTLEILHLNAPTITRSVVSALFPHHLIPYIQHLYPPPYRHTSTTHLFQLLHRHHAIQNTVATIVAFIQTKIYMIRTTPRIEHFAPYKDGLTRKMYAAAWTAWHYIEKYRGILVYEHPKHNPSTSSKIQSSSRFWHCIQCNELTSTLISTYPASRILEAYHFYTLLLSHLRASSRAPTYAGSIERAFRRWSRKPPTEEELGIIVILGGMERMAGKCLSVMKGTLNSRLEVVGEFVEQVEAAVSVARPAMDPCKEIATDRRERAPMDISPPLHLITASTLDLLPHLDDFFVQDFRRRIIEEDLLSELILEGDESEMEMLRNRELANPFGWIKRLMGEIDDENMRERRTAGAEGVGAM